MKKILIVDCESQYTKLIAKCIRNLNQYCEIIHYSKLDYEVLGNVSGIVFSGSWQSVNNINSPSILWNLIKEIPTLSICYSSQHLASFYNAKIISNSKKNGLLLVNCGKEGNVIRFMGPLTTPLNQVREAMEMFNNALEKI